MSTSGVYTFSRNRDQLITDALLLANIIDEDETPSSSMMDKANASLNAMVKHWQGTGVYIWTMAEATLFLQKTQTSYTLSSTSSDHATESFTETTLSAAAASGASTFTVTSATGLVAAQYLGIELDSGSWQFTTISSVVSTTVTPAAVLTGAAASGNRVIAYTTKIVRPLEITAARRYNFDSAIDTPIDVEDRETYFDEPNKTNSGTVNLIFYDRRGGANATGILRTWQSPSTIDDAIKFTWKRPIQDFSVAADDPDLPQEWIETIVYNLGARLALSYGNATRLQLIGPMAKQNLDEMRWNEKELGTVSFAPDMRR